MDLPNSTGICEELKKLARQGAKCVEDEACTTGELRDARRLIELADRVTESLLKMEDAFADAYYENKEERP